MTKTLSTRIFADLSSKLTGYQFIGVSTLNLEQIQVENPSFIRKLAWSLPWLVRYPLWRTHAFARRMRDESYPQHIIFIVANHFEPTWNNLGVPPSLSEQLSKIDVWCTQARVAGNSITDSDGMPFRHTYFFPAEEYHPAILEKLAELQSEGLGEVEIHLHHGVDAPDNARDLRTKLEDFRDVLAEKHKCLSRWGDVGQPMYAFIHGNWALANSAGGRFCGVDSEMEVLAETGCYSDFTLPSVPYQSQVPRINAIYQCGHPHEERVPHRSGPNLRVSEKPTLPVLFTGPLVFNWRRRIRRIPVPRMDDGSLAGNYPPSMERFQRWRNARIGVRGRPEWVFIKLYGHAFFPGDEDLMIGESMRSFLGEMLERATKSGDFRIHFATAREAFNIAMAAVDGRDKEPGLYRDYRLSQIMKSSKKDSLERRNLSFLLPYFLFACSTFGEMVNSLAYTL